MAEAKKNFLENYIESQKAKNKQKKKEKEAKMRAEGKDPENKFGVLDVLDPESGIRKAPVGPSIEELQESKLASMLDHNDERPASHKVKDAVAFTGPYVASGITKDATKAITKAASKVANSRVVNSMLDNALKGIGKISDLDRAAKLGDPNIVSSAKNAEKLRDEVSTARNLYYNALYGHYPDEIKNSLKGKKLSKKALESMKKAANMAELDADAAAETLRKKLVSTHAESIAAPKNAPIVANAQGKFDLNNADDLFEYSFTNPDKVRKNLAENKKTKQVIDSTAKKAGNLTEEYNELTKKTNSDAYKNLIKELKKGNVDALKAALKEANDIGDVEKLIANGRDISTAEKTKLRQSLIKDSHKNYKANNLFSHIMDPNDPLYKHIEKNADEIHKSDSLIQHYLDEGMSVQEAIQTKALDFIFNNADQNYIQELYTIAKGGQGDLNRVLRSHPFRNLDGSLKSSEEILKAIYKDPFYEELLKGLIKTELQFPEKAANYALAKSIEAGTVPLLSSYITRRAESNKNNLTDPFNKKSIDFLPHDMQPWNPKLEMNYADRFIGNAADMLLSPHSANPNRYTTAQKDLYRKAMVLAAEDLGFENPSQIEGLSDREMLALINKIGDGKYGYKVQDAVKQYRDKLIEERQQEK